MYLYRSFGGPSTDGVVHYHGSLADAHAQAKEIPLTHRPLARIERIDIKLEKAVMLAILNEDYENEGIKIVNCWRLSPRGGLVTCGVGE
jgi:hypothetical protein